MLDRRAPPMIRPRQTALGRLLQERREAAGYSRTRIGELVGIKPGTIEGWELGRVSKPPIHDVLRLAHFLRLSPEEVQQAVFADADVTPPATEPAHAKDRAAAAARSGGEGAVPLLEAAFRLFGWSAEAEAADALGTSAARVRRWRAGDEQLEFSEYLTLTSMIALAAAEAMKGDEARIADLSAAAELLGVRAGTVRSS